MYNIILKYLNDFYIRYNLNLIYLSTMKHKENRLEVITPKKPSKGPSLQLSSLKSNQTTTTKDFLSPFIENMLSGLPISTPLKQQPQFMFSPSPVKKDLFSQLLGSEIKNNSPSANQHISQNNMIMEQDDNDCIEDQSMRSNSDVNSEMSDSENDCFWQDENGVKKRKRKSTVQIKILKQQLQGQMNWTKQKISRMAQITGLSQSQVYKWCWDQKKKNMKYKQCQKRKLIKKQQQHQQDSSRDSEQENAQQENDHHHHQQQYKGVLKKQVTFCNPYQQMMQSRTKIKIGTVMDEAVMNTEKKINKKLVFY